MFGNNNTSQPVSSIEPAKKPEPVAIGSESSGAGKVVAIIILAITTAAFAGLFVWKLFDWIDASTNLQSQIDEAVAEAVLATETEMDAKFAEEQKNPYQTFLGPADYGSLSFSYPKTWSLYVAADAAKGGEYTAYMNPVEIPPINNSDTIMALRISIKSQAFDTIIKNYDSYVKSGKMNSNIVNINGDTATANVYRGTLSSPNGAVGIIAVMKIRDKTAVIQTDSLNFEDDFNKVLSSLSFNS